MCNICARCSKTMLVFWEILLSLSARRVWIEILLALCVMTVKRGHSPRGGCGLKSEVMVSDGPHGLVTLREEGVD